MECISVETLCVAAREPEEFITQGESVFSDRLSAAAEMIFKSREEKPIVLISGPSGSGKTTSATRIARLLAQRGCKAHTVSMDNYFLPMHMNESARDKDGKIDFESPRRLDIPLFKEHLNKLVRGERIDIPSFDFAAQERREGMPLLREKGDLVILEGIHALNPLLTGDFDESTLGVYVSVRTRIQSGDELLHPSKIRLMRRLMRDKLYRGRSLSETFEFFKSVERGENLYIMPYKHRADIDIDTFIEYEAPVYRDILLPELEKAADEYSDYASYADIGRFLKLLAPVDKELVPANSLIREFIG
ncbi:MAG: nucleoside kinase [Lachnospiraceae bacterium]|nr:nucleoside kinase [Ruminococcus sp.]MCM1275400.1 nucleoside kinase [Lachnospiraceae bacterium]